MVPPRGDQDAATGTIRHASADRISKQSAEFNFGDAGFTDQRPERSFSKFTVSGHSETAQSRMTKDNVVAGLVVHLVPHFTKGFDRVQPGANGSLLMRALPPLLP